MPDAGAFFDRIRPGQAAWNADPFHASDGVGFTGAGIDVEPPVQLQQVLRRIEFESLPVEGATGEIEGRHRPILGPPAARYALEEFEDSQQLSQIAWACEKPR